jgi:hypothetical protein
MTIINEGTTTQTAPAETPQPATTLTPEAIVELLRTVRAQIGDLAPMTAAQRKALRNRARTKNPVLQASINAIGASDIVSEAVGQPASEVRQKYDEANRWTAVEDELRSLLSGVAGANLIRRQEVALLAAQAANISTQLVRNPANAILVPHVQEIKRLKSFQNRKKAAPAPGTPQSPAYETPAAEAETGHQAPQSPGTSGSQ